MPKDGTLPVATPTANLALWEKLKRTNPAATKPFTRSGGFRGTQIDPTWRLQMMTEAFGPVGKGWGYEQVEWTVTEGMVFICCRVWYRDPETGEQCWTGPQWGGTELFRRKRDGSQEPTDEAFKMSITDAIGKCCLQLGLAADVYMGQFDDSKYREESEAVWAARSDPALSPEAIAKFDADVKRMVGAVADLDSLDELWRDGCKEAGVPPVSAKLREVVKVDKAAQHRIVAYFSQRKAKLLAKKDEPPKDERNDAWFAHGSYEINARVIGGLKKWCAEYKRVMAHCRTAREQQKLEADNADTMNKYVDKATPEERDELLEYQNRMWNRFVDEAALDALTNGHAPHGKAAHNPMQAG